MTSVNLTFAASLQELGPLLGHYPRVYLVYDRNVSSHIDRMPSDWFAGRFSIDASEHDKTIDTVMSICRFLMDGGADRKALLLGVGGGITTDIAGFAACIYKRGIRYANVPSTLLAQVDAGIGGKTGVNVDSFKNMIGVISQPEFTFICPAFIKTLPEREFLSGAAEMLKTFIIASRDSYHDAVRVLSSADHGRDSAELDRLIAAAASIKAEIVRSDERESDLRRVLNLGHTYAHAIEWYQHQHNDPAPMTHGEAVAAGIIRAAFISEQKGLAPKNLAEDLSRDFLSCGLPVSLPCGEECLQEAIDKDKKNKGGARHMVLIRRIGSVTIE